MNPFLPLEMLQRINDFCDTETQIAMREACGTYVTVLKGLCKGDLIQMLYEDNGYFDHVKYLCMNDLLMFESVDLRRFVNLEILDISGPVSIVSFDLGLCNKLKVVNAIGCRKVELLGSVTSLKYVIVDDDRLHFDDPNIVVILGKQCEHGFSIGHGDSCDRGFDPMLDSWVGHIAWELISEVLDYDKALNLYVDQPFKNNTNNKSKSDNNYSYYDGDYDEDYRYGYGNTNDDINDVSVDHDDIAFICNEILVDGSHVLKFFDQFADVVYSK